MAKFNTIQYITFASLGNTTDFGDLSAVRDENAATGCDGTKGVCAGGRTTPGHTKVDIIEYVNVSSLGNATDFGNLTTATTGVGGATNGTRLLIAGGDAA